MGLATEMLPLEVSEIKQCAAAMKEQGWRYVQMLCVNTDNGIDVLYTYNRDDVLRTYAVRGVQKDEAIPSVTDLFLAAFVFENEAHDLFGVNIEGIAIDFKGKLYALSQREPMTFISPAQKAAREKAAKLAAAKAAKAKKAAAANAGYEATHPEAKKKPEGVITPSGADDIDARLAGVDPEKVARVKAALAAKAKKAAEEAATAGAGVNASAPADPESYRTAKEGE